MTKQEFIESITLPGEVWKDVIGYEGRYIVSDFGRVASLPRYEHRASGLYPIKGKIKTPIIRGRKDPKYYYVDLYSGNKVFNAYMIHRLVAQAFLPNQEKKPCIDHIDGNQLNNKASNLRWCTHLENSHNPITRQRTVRARCHPILKLKDGKIVERFNSVNDAIKAGYNDCRLRICFRNPNATHRGFHWVRESDYENLVSMSKNA